MAIQDARAAGNVRPKRGNWIGLSCRLSLPGLSPMNNAKGFWKLQTGVRFTEPFVPKL
jgi:hypothetical protein